MSRMTKCILSTMIIVENKDEILLIESNNTMWPGLNLPGGHVEKDESYIFSAVRELKEETNLSAKNIKYLGLKTWIDLKHDYRYLAFIYEVSDYSGNLLGSPEGKPLFIKKSELKNYALADGVEEILKLKENAPFESTEIVNNDWEEDKL